VCTSEYTTYMRSTCHDVFRVQPALTTLEKGSWRHTINTHWSNLNESCDAPVELLVATCNSPLYNSLLLVFY